MREVNPHRRSNKRLVLTVHLGRAVRGPAPRSTPASRWAGGDVLTGRVRDDTGIRDKLNAHRAWEGCFDPPEQAISSLAPFGGAVAWRNKG